MKNNWIIFFVSNLNVGEFILYIKDLFLMERKMRDGYEKLVAIENRMAEHTNSFQEY